jgi:cold shock CspA family protein
VVGDKVVRLAVPPIGERLDMTSIRTGIITVYFVEKGYGFLSETAADGKKINHFFHITSCGFVPEIGQEVRFSIGVGRKGPAAINIELISPRTGIEVETSKSEVL